MPDGPRAQPRLVALDGVRAVAILGVLGVHAGLGRVPGGHLGVSVFFVLSGFLITTQLHREWKRADGIDLRHFYLRRAARLLPALFVVLPVAGLFSLLLFGWREVLLGAGSAALYVSNIVAALVGDEHMARFEWAWTLSLEEQFYLLWPAVLLFTLRRRGLSIAVAAAGVVASEVFRATGSLAHPPAAVYFAPQDRMGGLLLGAILALVLTGRTVRMRPVVAAGIAVGSLAVIAAGFRLGVVDARLTYTMWVPVVELATVALVVALLAGAGQVSTVLSWRPLAYLGLISYGVYLWNVPVMEAVHWAAGARVPGAVQSAVAVAATVGVAHLSWRYLEQPVLRRVPSRAPAALRTSGPGDS